MNVTIMDSGLVYFGEQGPHRYYGYPLKHVQTAIRRLYGGVPYRLASPIYNFSRHEVGALLVNAEYLLNYNKPTRY